MYWVSWRIEPSRPRAWRCRARPAGRPGAKRPPRATTGSRAASARWPSVWPRARGVRRPRRGWPRRRAGRRPGAAPAGRRAGGDGGDRQRVGQAGAVGEQGRQAASRVGPAARPARAKASPWARVSSASSASGASAWARARSSRHATASPAVTAAMGGASRTASVQPPRGAAPCRASREPGAVPDQSLLDRQFQPVAVAEAADRKGGREPGQQAEEGGVSAHGRCRRRRLGVERCRGAGDLGAQMLPASARARGRRGYASARQHLGRACGGCRGARRGGPAPGCRRPRPPARPRLAARTRT